MDQQDGEARDALQRDFVTHWQSQSRRWAVAFVSAALGSFFCMAIERYCMEAGVTARRDSRGADTQGQRGVARKALATPCGACFFENRQTSFSPDPARRWRCAGAQVSLPCEAARTDSVERCFQASGGLVGLHPVRHRGRTFERDVRSIARFRLRPATGPPCHVPRGLLVAGPRSGDRGL